MTMLEEKSSSVNDDVSTEHCETSTESDSDSIIELDLSPPRDNLKEMARYRWKMLKEIIRFDDNASRVSSSEKKMPNITLKKLRKEKASQLKAIRLEWDKKLKAAARRLENAHLQVEKSHVTYQENHVLLQKRMIELKQKAAVINHTKEDSQKIPDRTNSSKLQRELAEGNLKIRKIHAEFDRLKVRQKMLTKMSRQRESMMRSPGTPNGAVRASRSSSTLNSECELTSEHGAGVGKAMSSPAVNAPQYSSIRQPRRTSAFNPELEPTLEYDSDTFPPLSPQFSMASQHPSIRPGRRTSIYMPGLDNHSHMATASQHNSTKTSRTNSVFGSELEFTLQNSNGKIKTMPSQVLSTSPAPLSGKKRVNAGQDTVVASEALLAHFRSLGLASEAELLNTAEAERENAENRLKEELLKAKQNARAQMELLKRKERAFMKLQKMRMKFKQLIHLERQRIIEEALREKRREEALKRRAVNLKMKEEFKKLQHEARISSFYRTSYFEPRRNLRPHPLL